MKIILFAISLSFCLLAQSQTVSNVDSYQEGTNIVITYKLSTCTPNQTSGLFIYYAVNDERFMGPIKAVTGDVGDKLFTDGDKKAVWDVNKDLGGIDGNVKFKVETIPGQKVSLPSTTSNDFIGDVVKTERKGVDLYVSVKITNAIRDYECTINREECKIFDKNGNIIEATSFYNSGKNYLYSTTFSFVKDIPIQFTFVFRNVDMTFNELALFQACSNHKSDINLQFKNLKF